MTYYLSRRFRRRRKFKKKQLRGYATMNRRPTVRRFKLVTTTSRVRQPRRLRSLREVPLSKRWMTVKMVKIRRNFYSQIFFRHRLVLQQSSGQANPLNRQRPLSVAYLAQILLDRLDRFVKPHYRRRKLVRDGRWFPLLRDHSGRRGRYVLARARPLRRRRRRRLTVAFIRWSAADPAWIQVFKLFRSWFYHHRRFNLRVRVIFAARRAHNGQRPKKARRI